MLGVELKGSFRKKGLSDVVVGADSGEIAKEFLWVKSVRLHYTLSQVVVYFLHPSRSFSFSRFRTLWSLKF